MDGIRPVSPNFVMVGMMNPPKELPEDIKKFIEESDENGVIFVSFGSVLKASAMADSLRLKLLTVFSKLSQRVLWKWETEVRKKMIMDFSFVSLFLYYNE